MQTKLELASEQLGTRIGSDLFSFYPASNITQLWYFILVPQQAMPPSKFNPSPRNVNKTKEKKTCCNIECLPKKSKTKPSIVSIRCSTILVCFRLFVDTFLKFVSRQSIVGYLSNGAVY